MATEIFPLAGKRIWVTGHKGMVGSAIMRRLAAEKCDILTVDRQSLDLTNQADTRAWVRQQKPDAIFLAAAKVGGILANATYPAQFLHENLMIEGNVIDAAWRADVGKLLFLGSACIYPKLAPQPIVEDALLTGLLEPTNQWYAIAKIAGIKLCQAYRQQYGCDYISAMPANLYGPNDNFNPDTSHVIPALIRKAHAAKEAGSRELVIWGTGQPRREFLHVDDCADALVHMMKVYSAEPHVNVGSGQDLTILELAQRICDVAGFQGKITLDLSKPDGTPDRRLSTGSVRAMGWAPRIDLREGLAGAYAWYLANRTGHAARP